MGERIWLGKRCSTEEHIVADEDGRVRRSPNVRPHPTEQWNWGAFDEAVGLLWDPNGEGKEIGEGGETEHMINIPRAFDNPTIVRVETTPNVRRVIIYKEYLETFGNTQGCPKCRAIQSNNFECRGTASRRVQINHRERCEGRNIPFSRRSYRTLTRKLTTRETRRRLGFKRRKCNHIFRRDLAVEVKNSDVHQKRVDIISTRNWKVKEHRQEVE